MSKVQIKLSPPQYTLYHKLEHSIGQTPGVTVAEPLEEAGQWYIDITAKPTNRAVALASILIDRYDFGGIKVVVRVCEPGGGPLILSSLSSNTDSLSPVKEAFLVALAGNRYFVRVQDITDTPPFAPWGDLAVVFKPRVIQFWNDNLADVYGYSHFVAQDVFAEVLRSEFPGGVQVSFTTVVR